MLTSRRRPQQPERGLTPTPARNQKVPQQAILTRNRNLDQLLLHDVVLHRPLLTAERWQLQRLTKESMPLPLLQRRRQLVQHRRNVPVAQLLGLYNAPMRRIPPLRAQQVREHPIHLVSVQEEPEHTPSSVAAEPVEPGGLHSSARAERERLLLDNNRA